MKRLLLITFIVSGIILGAFLHKKHSELMYGDFSGRFDGYGQRATSDYAWTIPVIRPTTRYGFISSLHFTQTNWGGTDSPGGVSIAINDKDMTTLNGAALVKGNIYNFSFKQRFLDPKERYIMKISTAAEHGTTGTP